MISATEIPIYIALFVIPHDMHRLKWFLHIKWTFWAFCAGEWTRQVWPVRVRSFDERMWSSRECYFFCYLESCSDYYVAILGLHIHLSRQQLKNAIPSVKRSQHWDRVVQTNGRCAVLCRSYMVSMMSKHTTMTYSHLIGWDPSVRPIQSALAIKSLT